MIKFELGHLVKSTGVKEAMQEDENYILELVKCLERYCNKEWGTLCTGNKMINEKSLLNKERILGAYNTSKGKLYIFTEFNQNQTMMLLAKECKHA